MQIDELILVSFDDHVVEPPDLFEGRLSKEAAERAPFIEVQDNGREVWMFEGSALPNVGLNAVAGGCRRSTGSMVRRLEPSA
jgi:hypothetical protein